MAVIDPSTAVVAAPAYSRRAVFWAACLAMLVFGISVTSLGSLLPSLIARFGLGNAAAGALFPLLSVGMLAGSLVFGPIADRYGFKALLATCIGLIVVGLEAIALAPSLRLVGISLTLIGTGGGVVNGATSALVADVSDDGSRGADLSILGVFFGVGALGVPLLLAALLARFPYGPITCAVGAAAAIPMLVVLAIRFPPPKQPQGFPLSRGVALLRDLPFVLLGACLFFESGIELIASGWTAAYVQQALGVAAGRALLFLSLYWVGMIGGRLLLGVLGRRLRPAAVLYAAIATALAGALALVLAPVPLVAGVGITLIGLGFAPVFPVIMGFGGDRYPALSGTAFSVLLVMALTGGTALPWVTGLLGDVVGLRGSFLLVPAGLLSMAALFTAARRGLRARP